ncbi:MAG: hypothetical protein ACK4UN_12560 [Limisphaerales bacterium]
MLTRMMMSMMSILVVSVISCMVLVNTRAMIMLCEFEMPISMRLQYDVYWGIPQCEDQQCDNPETPKDLAVKTDCLERFLPHWIQNYAAHTVDVKPFTRKVTRRHTGGGPV